MNLVAKLLISLLLAVIATGVIVSQQLSGPLPVAAIIAVATVISALLPSRGTSASATSGAASGPGGNAGSEGERERGTVKWFNVSKGFGFVIRENGEEIFVHFRSIRGSGNQRRSLRDGQAVEFVVADSDKGPQAEDVEPL